MVLCILLTLIGLIQNKLMKFNERRKKTSLLETGWTGVGRASRAAGDFAGSRKLSWSGYITRRFAIPVLAGADTG